MSRVYVFFLGFLISTILITLYLDFKSSSKEDKINELVTKDHEPFPEKVPDVLKSGRCIDAGFIENEYVWIMEYSNNYPFVRISRNLDDDTIQFMAADQFILKVKDNYKITDFKPILDSLNLRVRTFNKNENILVVEVFNRNLDAFHKTLQELEDWKYMLDYVRPDYIEVKIN